MATQKQIASVRADSESADRPDISSTAAEQLASWTPVTVTEVEKLIGQAANKQCQLDPAPIRG